MNSKHLPILLLFLLLSPLSALDVPIRPQGPVADYAGIIDAPSEQLLTQLCQTLWDKAGFALVIATIPSLGELSIEEYAEELYKAWGVGAKGKDEGVLLLLSMEPRKVRIEVGYGAEGYLNDAKTGRMLDTYAVPYFRQGNYGRGIVMLSSAVAQAVAQEKQISLNIAAKSAAPAARYETVELSPVAIILIIVVLIIMVSTPFGRSLLFWIILSSLMGGGRRGGGGGFGGGFGGGGFGGGFGGGMSGGGGSSRSF